MEKRTQREYLPEFVYGGIDGIVTTFAIVAGSAGVSLSSAIILILGFANLFADGFSMAISSYLSIKSENELNYMHKRKHEHSKNQKKTALATFVSFVLIGFIPLIPFVLVIFMPIINSNKILYSIILTAIAFITVGAVRGKIVGKSKFRSAIETLLIGGIAAIIAFLVGFFLKGLVT